MNKGTKNAFKARWINWASVSCVLVVVVCLYINPSPIDPKPYTFPSPIPKLEGPLRANEILRKAERWFEGNITGPESFAVDANGTLYTGSANGEIFAVSNKTLTLVVRTGIESTSCGTYDFEPLCGRPKGMKFGSDGKLYVVDSYKGLLRVDVHTRTVEVLVSNEEGADGVPFKFLNSLDISSDGLVYFTDSSSKWERRNFRYEVLETHKAGRLLRYDVKSRRCATLLNDLYLANGVAVSRDQTYLIVSEMSVARIRRYYLKGPRAGTSDIFLDNLPGYPDNIKVNNRGNFYVGLASVRFQGASRIGSFLDLVGPYPAIKRFIASVTPLSAYKIFMPKHALVIEVNNTGTIVSSLHDPGAKQIGAVSELFQVNETLYIGHYQSPYLGVLYITKVTDI